MTTSLQAQEYAQKKTEEAQEAMKAYKSEYEKFEDEVDKFSNYTEKQMEAISNLQQFIGRDHEDAA